MIAEAEVRALAEGEVAPQPAARTLRRDESVIAEAVRLRGTTGQRFADAVRAALDQTIATAQRGVRAIGRLPKPARIGVIAAPFVVLGVALVALWPDRAAPLPAPVAPVAGAAPARVFVSRALDPATLPAPVAPGAAIEAAVPPATASAPAPAGAPPAPSVATALAPAADPAPSALERLRQQGPPATPLTVAETVRALPARASLYAAPKKGAPRTVSLAAGAEILTYPGVPVPEGWIVARKPEGEIGFLRTSALEPKPVPATVPKLPKAKRRALEGDDDAPPRAARADDRPRRRELDEEPPKRRAAPTNKPKRGTSGGKPLTADDLLLR